MTIMRTSFSLLFIKTKSVHQMMNEFDFSNKLSFLRKHLIMK